MASGEATFTPPSGDDRPQPVFDTVRKGFDSNQVLEYLKRVADLVDTLETRVKQLESELEEARRQRHEALEGRPAEGGADPYEALSARVTDLMRTFDEDVDRFRREAQVEADRIRGEAMVEAERIRNEAKGEADRVRSEVQGIEGDARAHAERVVREAREEADRILGDSKTLREAALNEFRIMRDRMAKAVRELEAITQTEEPEADRLVVLRDAGEAGSEERESERPRAPSFFRPPDIPAPPSA